MEYAIADSFDEWRSAVRTLLAKGVAPQNVQWAQASQNADLFFAASQHHGHEENADEIPHASTPVSMQVPRRMMDMLQAAACFRSPERWAFLYRVIWRWQRGEQDVLSAADEDGRRLHAMVKAVHREEHDMHAYVRFRERHKDLGPPQFVAWYEPAHDVLPQVAEHFAKRMGGRTWMIATPDASVLWNGKELHHAGTLMKGAADIEDSSESLWLTYYRSIFNPARLNTRVMQSHIPSRFWKNLPEGAVVPAMVAEASAGARRVGQATSLAQRSGKIIQIAAEAAQPDRLPPTVLEQCRRCELWQHATQAVRGSGPLNAQIMLVGEQPGDLEDIAGEPFIGPAGQLLDQVLEQAAIERSRVYLTNAVKHFKWEPRGKRRLHRTPGQVEIVACRHWLQEEIAGIKPRVIVALGSTALKSLLGSNTVSLSSVLGQPFEHDGYWIIASYHPAYALRANDPALKKSALDLMTKTLRKAQSLLPFQE